MCCKPFDFLIYVKVQALYDLVSHKLNDKGILSCNRTQMIYKFCKDVPFKQILVTDLWRNLCSGTWLLLGEEWVAYIHSLQDYYTKLWILRSVSHHKKDGNNTRLQCCAPSKGNERPRSKTCKREFVFWWRASKEFLRGLLIGLISYVSCFIRGYGQNKRGQSYVSLIWHEYLWRLQKQH